MKIKYVIFDFNGTMFWDTPLHNGVWDEFLVQNKIQLTDKEKLEKIHGKNNRDILMGIYDRPLTDDEIRQLSIEKELAYQEVCKKSRLTLAEGLLDFIRYLQEKDIRYTIATASDKINVDFYFEYLKIDRFFEYDKVVYNDGSMPGKPAPDMFLRAMKQIDAKPEECLIFEDSPTGILAATRAQAASVVIVNSTDFDYSQWDYPIIKDFREAIPLLN